MAMTPYPNGLARLENPSIIVSNDGDTWQVPDGLTNPVVPEPAYSYNSDPDLVFHGGKFWLFYRYWDTAETNSYEHHLHTSVDGINWTYEGEWLAAAPSAGWSPSFIVEGDTWSCWFASGRRFTTQDPNNWGEWGDGEGCTYTGLQLGHGVWHLDVIDEINGTYYMLANTVYGSNPQRGDLVLATSTDGRNWQAGAPFIRPSASGWDNRRIYRATGVIDDGTLDVWYSAVSSSGVWRIGRVTVPLTAVLA